MRILEGYTSRYTSKVSIEHRTFQHQWYRQVLEMTIYETRKWGLIKITSTGKRSRVYERAIGLR